MNMYQVRFATPSMGVMATPLPLSGDGSLEILEGEILLSGMLGPSSSGGLLSLVPVFLGVAGLTLVVRMVLPDATATPVGIGLGTALFGGRIKRIISPPPAPAQGQGEPVKYKIRFEDVLRLNRHGENSSEMRLLVKAARLNDQKIAKREILFYSEQHEALLLAFRERKLKTNG